MRDFRPGGSCGINSQVVTHCRSTVYLLPGRFVDRDEVVECADNGIVAVFPGVRTHPEGPFEEWLPVAVHVR